MDEHARAVQRFNELDQNIKDLLSKLEPGEVETLKYLSTIPKDEARSMMKLYRDIKAVGWFMKWLIIGMVGLFIGTVALYENILKVYGWMRGSP